MDETLISNPVENQWVVEITKILDHQIEINREIPSVSIFHLPESITRKKPEAYEPQQTGLGPIHHFRPGPYRMMEQQKLVVARKQLKESEIEDGKDIVLNKVRELVPIVRSCYDLFLQDDDESLAWIFAIDGLFLLNLLQTYNIGMGEKEDYLLKLEKLVNESIQKKPTNQNLPSVLDEVICESSYPEGSTSLFMSESRTVCVADATDLEESDEFGESSDFLNPLPRPKKVLDEVICESSYPEESTSLLMSESRTVCVADSTDLEESDEFGESSDFLNPLPRPKKVVVTSKNRTKFEKVLGLPNQQFQKPKFGTTRRKLVQDIMMVGNQIPFMVLKEINEALHPSSGSFSPSNFRIFCKIHSPLKLCPKSKAPTNNVEHVLHYMYYSILHNYTPDYSFVSTLIGKFRPAFKSAEIRSDFINPINFISKVPKEEIIQVYEKTVSYLETFIQSKILIPSASKLHNRAGFMFKVLHKHQGIQNIYKNDKDIYLPCVTLNIDSEVILRNLVAYETLTADPEKFPLTEYMGLMCALIVNVDDVKYLRDQKVIDGDMGNDEVAKLFVGMSTSIQPVKTKEKSNLQKMIDEVNTVYNIGLEMKMYLQMKKLARWLLVGLKAIGKFVENSWKIVAFMVSIVTVFMLTYQAYCDVYGCDEKAVTLLPYASS